jgi:D-arginine dehydrogenase
METQDFGAVVIGAGMAGASVAAHLAPHRRVAVLEQEDSAGFHTTGRSAALWEPNYGQPDTGLLTRASRDFLLSPPAGFSAIPLVRPRLSLHLAPEEQRPLLEEALAGFTEVEPISLEAAHALVPALRPGYAAAAMLERGTMDIDVAALHQGFLQQARAAGGILALRHRAGRIWKQAGLWHTETAGGTVFRAPVLVNAAGAWGDAVAAAAGLRPLGLSPRRRTAVIIDPAPWDAANWPLVGDIAGSWYLRPEARSRIMLSPADETESEPCDARPEELDIAVAIDRMQQALDIPVRRVEHSWAGLRSFLPGRSMAIGEAGEPGFFFAIGQGGYGIQTAPAQGRLLTALIEGQDPGELAAAIPLVDPRRFEAAQAPKVPA